MEKKMKDEIESGKGLGFRGSGFRGSGFRGLGFRG